MANAIRNKTLTQRELRALFLGRSSEKSEDVLPGDDSEGEDEKPSGKDKPRSKKPKGHGRNGADQYTGAKRVKVPHPSLQPGDPCPICTEGTVYEKKAMEIVRLSAGAPVCATVHECERLRCGLCGATFTAGLPPEAGKSRGAEKGSQGSVRSSANRLPPEPWNGPLSRAPSSWPLCSAR